MSEVSSPGLRQRSEALFGPVTFDEGYGISETWPFGGTQCEEGHLHFEPSHGLMEVVDPDSGKLLGMISYWDVGEKILNAR